MAELLLVVFESHGSSEVVQLYSHTFLWFAGSLILLNILIGRSRIGLGSFTAKETRAL